MIFSGAASAILLTLSGAASSVDAAPAIDTAFLACERWILDPATHTERPQGFAAAAGFDGKLAPRTSVPDEALPPPQLRVAMRHWYVAAGGGGLFLTVSDTLLYCHISGGGPTDMKPAIEEVLGSKSFERRWKVQDDALMGDMWSTKYGNRKQRNLFMIVSRAKLAGDRTDRPQLLATAELKIGN